MQYCNLLSFSRSLTQKIFWGFSVRLLNNYCCCYYYTVRTQLQDLLFVLFSMQKQLCTTTSLTERRLFQVLADFSNNFIVFLFFLKSFLFSVFFKSNKFALIGLLISLLLRIFFSFLILFPFKLAQLIELKELKEALLLLK